MSRCPHHHHPHTHPHTPCTSPRSTAAAPDAAAAQVASYLLYALLFNRSLKIAAKWPHVAAYCAKVAAYYCATAPRPLPAPFVLTAPRPQAAQRPAYVKAFGADVAQNLAARALA